MLRERDDALTPLEVGTVLRAGQVGGCASVVYDVIDDDEQPDVVAVIADDVAGLTIAEILGADDGGVVDPAVAAAVLLPVAQVLRASERVVMDLYNVIVTWDGQVRFDGFLQAALTASSPRPAGPGLARLCLALGLLPLTIDERLDPIESPPGEPMAPSLSTLCDAIEAWARTVGPAPPSALRDLARGLAPSRAAREDSLRERLAMLDDETIGAILGEARR